VTAARSTCAVMSIFGGAEEPGDAATSRIPSSDDNCQDGSRETGDGRKRAMCLMSNFKRAGLPRRRCIPSRLPTPVSRLFSTTFSRPLAEVMDQRTDRLVVVATGLDVDRVGARAAEQGAQAFLARTDIGPVGVAQRAAAGVEHDDGSRLRILELQEAGVGQLPFARVGDLDGHRVVLALQ